MIGRIYIIKNTVNDKVYIGQTTSTLEDRFYKHKLHVKSDAKTKLYKAMYDIGMDKFYIELLEERSIDNSIELTRLEREYILKYDSVSTGYNSVLPLDGIYVRKCAEHIDELIADYINGVPYSELCVKYNTSKGNISRVCSLFKHLRETPGYEYTNLPKPVIMYDKDNFCPIRKFESIKDAYLYLVGINKSVTKSAAYYYVAQSCEIGTISYGYRWQRLADISYGDMIFRSKFDKEAYLSGKQAYKINNKTYLICNDTLNHIKGLNTCERACDVCGKIIVFNINYCDACDKECTVQYKCRVCKIRTVKYSGSICQPCSQVLAQGKCIKPSREELEILVNKGLTNKEIGKLYDRKPNTVSYWIKSYGIR